MSILQNDVQSDYRILVSRSDFRPKADLLAFNLQHPIPSFQLPLRDKDIEPIFDLQTILNELYDRASYDLVIDYNKEPIPGLSKTNQEWLDILLRQQGLR